MAAKSIRVKKHRKIWENENGKIPEGFEIDHINRDDSDNRLENLRLATHSENNRNVAPKKKRAKIHSKYKGVNWHNNRWRATITHPEEKEKEGSTRGKQVSLGTFHEEILAAVAYNEMASIFNQKYGDYFYLNKIDLDEYESAKRRMKERKKIVWPRNRLTMEQKREKDQTIEIEQVTKVEDFWKYTMKELQNFCMEKNISFHKQYRKEKLIEIIERQQSALEKV